MNRAWLPASTPAVDRTREVFAADVRYYLSQQPRQLPSRYFYDALGSALFDAICHLPWYPLTRAELRLLRAHARAIVTRDLATLVELGAGNGEKLMTLLEAGGAGGDLALHLIDVSASALSLAARALEHVANRDGIVLHESTYEHGLYEFAAARRRGRALALFLGSNIGNFDPPGREALLVTMRKALVAGDGLLLGADLVKPEATLLAAYDDPLGVTAAFNRNLLVRINRELAGNFDLEGFCHQARWNAGESRVEMHLVSTRHQGITVSAADLEFEMTEGESIWTESSYKFTREEIAAVLARSGFQTDAQWIDTADEFALTLATAT